MTTSSISKQGSLRLGLRKFLTLVYLSKIRVAFRGKRRKRLLVLTGQQDFPAAASSLLLESLLTNWLVLFMADQRQQLPDK